MIQEKFWDSNLLNLQKFQELKRDTVETSACSNSLHFVTY